MNLDAREWRRVGGYALWGFLLYVIVVAGVPYAVSAMFHTSPKVLNQRAAAWVMGILGKTMGISGVWASRRHWIAALVILDAPSFLLHVLGLLWSAESILRRGPQAGRLPWTKLGLLASGVAVLEVGIGVGQLRITELNGPRWLGGLFEIAVKMTRGIPLAWSLAWALDVVRRQRAASAPPA